MDKKTITAKELVKKFSISYHTLNYYAAIGLIPVVSKIGNIRYFDEDEVKLRLEKISELIKEGYPLNLIRKRIIGA